jgi:hypothetical protein
MDIFPRLQEIDDPEAKAAIKESLLAYCHLDTLAMVKIWEKLNEITI